MNLHADAWMLARRLVLKRRGEALSVEQLANMIAWLDSAADRCRELLTDRLKS